MSWYNAFNAVEAGLWLIVAIVIWGRVPSQTAQQRAAVRLGAVGFIAFGLTDLLEIGRAGALPLWLWGGKIACGVALLAAWYAWRGWREFSWRDREVRFGFACLLAVVGIVLLQRWLGS